MKIVLTEWCRSWEAREPQKISPAEIDLTNEKQLFYLVVSLGNGNFDEACIECESEEAQECVHGLLVGTGGAERLEESASLKEHAMFRPGYKVYLQGRESYFFVNPSLRSELFNQSNLDAYANEFGQANAKR